MTTRPRSLKTTSPEIAARLLETRATIDVVALLDKVQTPALVLHSRDDDVVPISEGHILAAGIPGAQFIELDSKNHVLIEHEPAWDRFKEAVSDFLGVGAPPGRGVFDQLSAREREILSLIAQGLANAEIGERLSISDKTVTYDFARLMTAEGASGVKEVKCSEFGDAIIRNM